MSDFYIPSDDDAPSDATESGTEEAPTFEIAGASPKPVAESEFILAGDVDPDDPTNPPPPSPSPPQPSPPVRPSSDDGGLHDRIAATTRSGGFGSALPPLFDDPDATPAGEDWRVALSDDPFERLYLDWTQADRISQQTVRQHTIAIARFWEKRAAQLEAGADARDRIQRRYGDRTELRRRAQQARDDGDALATPPLRAAAVEARLDTLRTRTVKRLEDFLLGDRTLSPPEIDRILEQAVTDGWTRSAAAQFVLGETERRDLRPLAEPDPIAAPIDRLRSTSWTELDRDTSAETVLGAPLATAMLGGSITPPEIAAFLDLAMERGLDREDAAAFIADRLGVFRDEWCPAPGESSIEGSLSEALASVRWVSPERFPDLLAVARNAHAHATAAALAGGTLTSEAARALLDRADLKRDDAATFVLDVLRSRDYEPTRVPSEGSHLDRLLSTDWVTPRKAPPLPPSPDSSGRNDVDPVAPPSYKKGILIGALVGLAALVVWVLVGWPFSPSPPTAPMATIDTDRANIRTEPSVDGEEETIIGTSTRGERIEVTGYAINSEGKTWLRVDHRNGSGWVSDKIVQFTRYDEIPELGLDGRPLGRATTGEPGVPIDDLVADTDAESESSGSLASVSRRDELPPSPPSQPTPRLQPVTTPPAPRPQPPPEPPPPTRPPDRVYSSANVDRPATPSTSPRADSPPGGYSGAVKVDVEVGADGRVTSARCATSAPQSTCAEAERRSRSVSFRPAQLQGYGVRSRSDVTVVFTAAQQPLPPAATSGCTVSAIRALAAEVNQTDARCRRLRDPAEKRDCEARFDRANAELSSCTQ